MNHFIAALASSFLVALLGSHSTVCAQAALASQPSDQLESSQPALVWSYVGTQWHPVEVSLGNRGTQVLAGLWHNPFVGSHASLLSRHDSASPPTPWWTAADNGETAVHAVSAADTDTHVTLTSENSAISAHKIYRINKFSSKGLDWVYTHPQPINGNALAGVSRDGSVIAAAIGDTPTGVTHVLVFGPDSAVPVRDVEIPVGPLLGFDLAARGTHTVINIGALTCVMDLRDGSLHFVVDQSPSSSSSGRAISGDGSVVGCNIDNGMALFEWNGSDYVQTWFRAVAGNAVVDISDDASTMAYGLDFLYLDKRIITECVDIPSKTVTMSEDITSTGQYGNGIEDIAVTPDGRFFVTATWGDEFGLSPEVRLYSRTRSVPVGTLDLPGSAISVDLSDDGRWIVVGSYPVHIQVPSNSGRVDLIHVGRSDFTMTTTPQLGATVSFQVFGEPGRDAYLLSSPHVSAPGLTVPGWGTLHLDPAGLSIRPIGVIGPDGSATTDWTLPSNPALLGVSHYYQGLTDSARHRLTWDWLVVTNLP